MKIEIRRTRVRRRFYARIVASNGQVLFTSEVYNRKEDALHLAELLKSYAPLVVIEDLT